MTAFRRRVRLQQARWRDEQGHPIGTQPILPREGKPARPVGSRLPLDYAQETGANFVTPGALDAARHRLAHKEARQVLSAQRVCADLLWSEPFGINLFGDLAHDLASADHAAHTLWPDAPGTVTGLRFAHSPGRLDLDFIGSLVTWDVAFELDAGGGTKGYVALVTPLHERIQRQIAKPVRVARYREVLQRSKAFRPKAFDAVDRTDLVVLCLQHLLLLSTLQHESRAWSWGRFVVVHPTANTDFADAVDRYRELLVDDTTFASMTTGELLDADALPARTVRAVRARFPEGL